MRGPNRRRKPGRREPFRDPRPIMLIVCEGENTEPQYFEQFAHHHRNSRVRVKVAEETGVPLSLVQVAKRYMHGAAREAIRQHDENLAIDSVWCVFDIDEHPNVPQAKQMARDSGIGVAVSNPCFELWLLLHLRDSPGMQHRHNIQRALKSYIPEYDKHVKFEHYRNGYNNAVARAKRLDALAQSMGTPGCNPTTNVYELTEIIAKVDDKEANIRPPDSPLGAPAVTSESPGSVTGGNQSVTDDQS